MDVLAVFISSIQREFGHVREEARRAIESFGMYPLLAERAGASPQSPQRALLELVSQADAMLLLIGPRYGERGASGMSPTEEEYAEAIRLGRTVMVLVQDCERDPDQEEFLQRVAPGWEQGRLWGTFKDESHWRSCRP